MPQFVCPRLRPGIVAVVAMLAAGCAGHAGEVAGPNTPPTASAGSDQDVTRGSMVTLVGSAADPDGQSPTLTWSQVSGPSVGPLTGPMPTFTAPNEVTTLEFDLVASDGRESSAADRVVVWVLEDAAHALWVAPGGNDANPGTRASPKLTIQAAIDASADGADVYLTAGTWIASATITLRAGVSLYGGFHATTFLRDPPANETVVTGTSTAISGTGVNALTIDGLTIQSADGIATGPDGNRSSVGIAFQNSDDVVITRNRIIAGNGITGAQGTFPPRPANGNNGGLGAGSSGGSGGRSGGGGSRPGGSGGDGGGSFAGVCTSGGTNGGSGLGPSPGLGGAGNDSDGNGGDGGHGAAGINGLNATGAAQSFGSVAAGAYVPAPGGNGGPGTDGSSGGGGGGGDCLVVGFLTTVHGGGGGGGGAGGEGAGGGGGGQGGGASVGILVTGQSTGLAITDNVIITGNGGNGGLGASVTLGGPGGDFASGARVATNGTLGGSGGRGGDGGHGGAGGGGGGGPTIGVVVDATSATNLSAGDLAGNVITLGAAGLGGIGGYDIHERFAPSGADGLRAELAVNP